MSDVPSSANRFRPEMESLEAREAPAAITLPDFYNVRAGRILNRTAINANGVAGVLRNDTDDTQGAAPPFRNAGMTARVTVPPVDTLTGLFVTNPFTFNSNGGFTFRAPKNYNGVIQFNYIARAADGSLSGSTPAFITVTGPIRRLAVAADQGRDPVVAVYDARTNFNLFTLQPFDTGFRGGVRVATGDFNRDNIDDIVTAAGPGAGPHVKIYNGATGAEMASFFAFNAGFQGGLEVSAGDLNNDDVDDLVVSAGQGRDAHVRVFDGTKVAQGGFNPETQSNMLANFYAYGNGEVNGVRTAVGDIAGTSTGLNQLIVAPAQGGTFVKAYDISGGGLIQTKGFFAGAPNDTRGLYVTAGDFNGDYVDDIAVGSGSGRPEARIYVNPGNASANMVPERGVAAASYSDGFVADAFTNPFNTSTDPNYLLDTLSSPTSTPTQFVGAPTSSISGITGGMRVATSYANRDDFADLVLGQGPNGYSRLQILDGRDFTNSLYDFTVFPGYFGGLNIAGHA